MNLLSGMFWLTYNFFLILKNMRITNQLISVVLLVREHFTYFKYYILYMYVCMLNRPPMI